MSLKYTRTGATARTADECCSLQELGDPAVDSAELFANTAGKQMGKNYHKSFGV